MEIICEKISCTTFLDFVYVIYLVKMENKERGMVIFTIGF